MDSTPGSNDLPAQPPPLSGETAQGARQTVSILSDLNAGQASLQRPLTARASRGKWIGMGLMLAAGAGGALFLLHQETPAPRLAAVALRPPPGPPIVPAAPPSALIRELPPPLESPAPRTAVPVERSGPLETQAVAAPAKSSRSPPQKALEPRSGARPNRPAPSKSGGKPTAHRPTSAPDSERDIDIVTAIVK